MNYQDGLLRSFLWIALCVATGVTGVEDCRNVSCWSQLSWISGAKLIYAKVQEISQAEKRYSIRAHSRDKELLEETLSWEQRKWSHSLHLVSHVWWSLKWQKCFWSLWLFLALCFIWFLYKNMCREHHSTTWSLQEYDLVFLCAPQGDPAEITMNSSSPIGRSDVQRTGCFFVNVDIVGFEVLGKHGWNWLKHVETVLRRNLFEIWQIIKHTCSECARKQAKRWDFG